MEIFSSSSPAARSKVLADHDLWDSDSRAQRFGGRLWRGRPHRARKSSPNNRDSDACDAAHGGKLWANGPGLSSRGFRRRCQAFNL